MRPRIQLSAGLTQNPAHHGILRIVQTFGKLGVGIVAGLHPIHEGQQFHAGPGLLGGHDVLGHFGGLQAAFADLPAVREAELCGSAALRRAAMVGSVHLAHGSVFVNIFRATNVILVNATVL